MDKKEKKMNFTVLSKCLESPEKVIEFCQLNNLIANQQLCKKCHYICILVTRTRIKDKYSWRCTNKKCRLWVSLKTGTIFAQSNLEIGRILKLIYLWSHGVASELTVQHECSISSPSTITDWKNFLREVCREYFKNNRCQIGGPGHTVELGEILFNRSKYNRNNSNKVVQPLWVLGGYDLQDEQGFLVPVPNLSPETLLPIIKKYVLPGSTVVSDSWKTFNKLGEGYRRLALKNRLDFIEPPQNSTEGGENMKKTKLDHVAIMWKEATQKNKKECAASKSLLETYLLEFMWRQQFKADPFLAIIQQIAYFYPCQPQILQPSS